MGKWIDKALKKPIQEFLTVNAGPIKISARDKKKKKVRETNQPKKKRSSSSPWRNLEEKKNHLPDSNVSSMLELRKPTPKKGYWITQV